MGFEDRPPVFKIHYVLTPEDRGNNRLFMNAQICWSRVDNKKYGEHDGIHYPDVDLLMFKIKILVIN